MKDQNDTFSINLNRLLVPISIFLVGLMISGAIFFGLRGAQPRTQNLTGIDDSRMGPTPESGLLPQENQGSGNTLTSIDNDPVMGDRTTAQVAIVEFSDYECPFCNRFRTETLPQIKKEYLDTGKAILVYRDLPLPFHNPAAEREAMAAECAREQGGDEAYFQYHDQIFETSPGNGQGISVSGLGEIAGQLRLSTAEFKKCLEEERYKEEVAQDAADAAKAGINGTPGFVIGKLDQQGQVEGTIISGARPFADFQKAIESFLN